MIHTKGALTHIVVVGTTVVLVVAGATVVLVVAGTTVVLVVAGTTVVLVVAGTTVVLVVAGTTVEESPQADNSKIKQKPTAKFFISISFSHARQKKTFNFSR
ncbi:MAG: hypothetical protein P8L35_02730 [Acidimicrobiales bacterium]|nr:hypothetical protein [Acidimicrobiales bacterium]